MNVLTFLTQKYIKQQDECSAGKGSDCTAPVSHVQQQRRKLIRPEQMVV